MLIEKAREMPWQDSIRSPHLCGFYGRHLIFFLFIDFADLSETERPDLPTSGSPRSDCQALNYSALASAAGAVTPSAESNLNSTENLLRNIQGLLKVAADNARQQERQINFEKGKSVEPDQGFILLGQYSITKLTFRHWRVPFKALSIVNDLLFARPHFILNMSRKRKVEGE